MLQQLINWTDNYETVRDKIATLLKEELANQVAIAEDTEGANPDLYRLHVYTERSNAWDVYINPEHDHRPIVSVSYAGGDFDMRKGDVVNQQTHDAMYTIDCYGYGETNDTVPGDEISAKEAQRAMRLVRNILMSAENTHLKLRGTVGRRWPVNIQSYMPPFSDDNAVSVRALRLQLAVSFPEFSPQYEGERLELVTNTFKRAEDGEILLEANYEYDTEEEV